MLSLPMLAPHEAPVFRQFGTEARPLRPSKIHRLLTCPMSVFLDDGGDSGGGRAAQTGNLVHSAVAEYHTAVGTVDERTAAGLAALAAARDNFPVGDQEKATSIFRSYAADTENSAARVFAVERQVRLDLDSPDGVPVVIIGTLDQIRFDPNGILRVWDVKTGGRLDANATVEEYLVQQAVYTLAARQSIEPDIQPGGIIYTPGYEKPRGRRFLPLKLSVDQCMMLMVPVVTTVVSIRQGIPAYRPSAEACQYCPVRPYSQCLSMLRGIYR